MTPCLRCGQDYLLQVRIIPLDEIAVICPECDALWRNGDALVMANSCDYRTYMESKQLNGLWDHLEELGFA